MCSLHIITMLTRSLQCTQSAPEFDYETVAELRKGSITYVFRLRKSDSSCGVRKLNKGVLVNRQNFRTVDLMRQRFSYLQRDGFTVA